MKSLNYWIVVGWYFLTIFNWKPYKLVLVDHYLLLGFSISAKCKINLILNNGNYRSADQNTEYTDIDFHLFDQFIWRTIKYIETLFLTQYTICCFICGWENNFVIVIIFITAKCGESWVSSCLCAARFFFCVCWSLHQFLCDG